MTLLAQMIEHDYGFEKKYGRYRKAKSHDSLVYDAEKDLFFWNSKEIFGDALAYLLKVRKLPYTEAKAIIGDGQDDFFPERKIVVPPVVVPDLVNTFYDAGRNNKSYWYEKRGYTDETIDRFKLGYTGEWYTIPVFERGEFVNFQLRKEFPKKAVSLWYTHKGPHAFNFSQLTVTDWVVITEGPPDCIMLRQNNIPAVSQTSGSGYWNTKWNTQLIRMKEIYVFYDNDEAGYKGVNLVAKNFGYKAKVYNFQHSDKKGYDITDYFKEGHTREDFMNLLKRAKYYWEINYVR